MVHMSRNPLDTVVSFHHWYNITIGYQPETMSQTLDKVLTDWADYCPLIEHTLMYWDLEKQGHENILYLTYEDIIQDMDGVIEKTQKFLGKNYPKEKLAQLKDHLSFDKMKSLYRGIQFQRNPIESKISLQKTMP